MALIKLGLDGIITIDGNQYSNCKGNTQAAENMSDPNGIIFFISNLTRPAVYKYTEFVDENGQPFASRAAVMEKLNANFSKPSVSAVEMEAIREQQYAYGVVINSNIASSALPRIGNVDKHRTLPIHEKMRRCLLRDDGTVNYYLHRTDSTKRENGTAAVLDGSDGQVMVEIPEHYRKVTDIDGIRTVLISEVRLNGYERIKKCYISAYQAALDRSTNKLASVVNTTPNFRGGSNTVAWDGTYRSLLGKPATLISITDFRAYARTRGSVSWNCLDYNVYKTLFYIYVIEYANLNSQLAFNSQPDQNGFRQGGLGAGVTNLDGMKWNTYNSYNPFLACGLTNALGNATGVVSFNMPSEYDAVIATVSVPSYRGVENIFGHIWHWTDGLKIEMQSGADGGKSRLFVNKDPAAYNDANYNGYTFVGLVPRTEQYITRMIDGEIMPAAVGGNSSTYYCDYFYTNIPAAGVEQRWVLLGGNALYPSNSGLACSRTANAPSSASIGSRLCYYTP